MFEGKALVAANKLETEGGRTVKKGERMQLLIVLVLGACVAAITMMAWAVWPVL